MNKMFKPYPMHIQLWRNATIQIAVGKTNILIDPMLGEKGAVGPFPFTNDQRENPLVPLPFSEEELRKKLKCIDAVFVSHLHPDHWDEAAIRLIEKKTTIICPEPLAKTMASYGFQNIDLLKDQIIRDNIQLHLTNGQHGTGDIGKHMGQVNGIVLEHLSQKLYIAGDTIWCPEVKEAINKHRPQHIIVAGGAATFAIGDPVTMTGKDIKALCEHAPKASIWITHLEAVSPCRENRTMLTEYLKSNGLLNQCKILADGEEVELN